MKINWKVRFRNGAFLLAFFVMIISFIYNILGMFDIVPSISESMIIEIITAIVQAAAMLGIVTDPTTSSISDSKQALTYTSPKED